MFLFPLIRLQEKSKVVVFGATVSVVLAKFPLIRLQEKSKAKTFDRRDEIFLLFPLIRLQEKSKVIITPRDIVGMK